MLKLTPPQQEEYESPELRQFVVPVLRQWTGERRDLDVVELGPAHTTAVPVALSEKLRSYTAVDFSPPYLRKQREFLAAHDPELAARSKMVISDSYDLTMPDSSSDLIVTSCHPPLVSASIALKKLVIDKIHALLRPDASFVVFPWYFAEQQNKVNRHLLKRFHLLQLAFQQCNRDRVLLVLGKR